MKSLIITVAGLSSRFNRDLEQPVLKCLYYEGNPYCSLLSMQISKTYEYVDEIVIVGGYKYDDLTAYITKYINDNKHKIKAVYNEHYHDYGSGYSLIKGIELLSKDTDEVAFIEGDLLFNEESVESVLESKRDVISVNNEPILADKAVVLYFDANCYPHYVYDIKHSCLEIHEPFTAVYNSGQMWKFRDPARVREICRLLTPEQEKGTNLEIVQAYFGSIKENQLDIIHVRDWHNCNTLADYQGVYQTLTR